jgi:hypothetical protein
MCFGSAASQAAQGCGHCQQVWHTAKAFINRGLLLPLQLLLLLLLLLPSPLLVLWRDAAGLRPLLLLPAWLPTGAVGHAAC